jgi:dUTP pyrophosphatase
LTIVEYKGRCPEYGTNGAAGADLFLPNDAEIPPRSTSTIPLNINLQIPAGYFGWITDRSSMARKGLHTLAGIVDSDYRGELGWVVTNLTDKPVCLHKGDKVAQLIILKAENAGFLYRLELDSTERGEGGFGSTGK